MNDQLEFEFLECEPDIENSRSADGQDFDRKLKKRVQTLYASALVRMMNKEVAQNKLRISLNSQGKIILLEVGDPE